MKREGALWPLRISRLETPVGERGQEEGLVAGEEMDELAFLISSVLLLRGGLP